VPPTLRSAQGRARQRTDQIKDIEFLDTRSPPRSLTIVVEFAGKKNSKRVDIEMFRYPVDIIFYGGNLKCLQTLKIGARDLLRRLNSQCDQYAVVCKFQLTGAI